MVLLSTKLNDMKLEHKTHLFYLRQTLFKSTQGTKKNQDPLILLNSMIDEFKLLIINPFY